MADAKAKSKKTILLVDDHEAVRVSVGELLQLQGYNILLAADGQEALEIASNSDDPIDLLITDVILPKLSGRELAQRIHQVQSTIKVLFISGYSEQAAFQNFENVPETADFIQKPCSMEALLQKIRSLLNESVDP
jgi:Response regulator containing CheY-like receiver, AAA-type ATPase, and DNA-binding domains